MKKLIPALVAVILCAAGCARVQVNKVTADSTKGVHFYEPRPYLLISKVTKDKQVEYTTQIIYLPDVTKRYSVVVKPGWGTVDGSVKLVNGWMLESVGSKMDSKIPETIGAIAGLVKEVAAIKDGQQGPEGLYRIDIANDGTLTLTRQGSWK